MNTLENTEKPSGQGVGYSDLLDLFRRMQNAHYSMAADEYNENASYSAISRRADKYERLELEFKTTIHALIDENNSLKSNYEN